MLGQKTPKRRRDDDEAFPRHTDSADGSFSAINTLNFAFQQSMGLGSTTPVPAPALVLSSTITSEYFTNFKELGVMGSGSFGTVLQCIKRIDNQVYAVKKSLRPLESESMLREVLVLASLEETRHIVRYYNAWIEDGHLYIQMEKMDYSLDTLVSSPLTEATLMHILHDCLVGLSDIHKQQIVHLDIKPANLFFRNGKYKIGDLGLARHLATVTRQVEEGDARYLAMELLSDKVDFLPQADIFSLGASVYELARGYRLPGSGDEWTALRSGIITPLPNISPRFNAILKRMMHPDPAQRPTADVLLRDHMFPSEPTPAEDYYRQLAAVYRERWLSLGRCYSSGYSDGVTTPTPALTPAAQCLSYDLSARCDGVQPTTLKLPPISGALPSLTPQAFVATPIQCGTTSMAVRRSAMSSTPASVTIAPDSALSHTDTLASPVFRPAPPSRGPSALSRPSTLMKFGRCLSLPQFSIANRAVGALESTAAPSFVIDEANLAPIAEVERHTLEDTASSPLLCDDITPDDLKRDDSHLDIDTDVNGTATLSHLFMPPPGDHAAPAATHPHPHLQHHGHERVSLISLAPPLPVPSLTSPMQSLVPLLQLPMPPSSTRPESSNRSARTQRKFVFSPDDIAAGSSGSVLNSSGGLFSVLPSPLHSPRHAEHLQATAAAAALNPRTPPRKIANAQPRTPRHRSSRSMSFIQNMSGADLLSSSIPVSSPVLSATTASDDVSAIAAMAPLLLDSQHEHNAVLAVAAFAMSPEASPSRHIPRLLFNPDAVATCGAPVPVTDLNTSGVSSVAMSPT